MTANEIEALILESNYVKKHKPRHNVLLRDDKHFPYMKLSTGEGLPAPEHRSPPRGRRRFLPGALPVGEQPAAHDSLPAKNVSHQALYGWA